MTKKKSSLLSPIQVALEIQQLEIKAKKWTQRYLEIKPQDISGCCGQEPTRKGKGGLNYIDKEFE